MSESLFAPYDPQQLYRGALWPSGGTEIAYRTKEIEIAMREDSVPKIKEAIALGWINRESRCFDGSSIVHYAILRGYPKVAKYLRAEGWPE